MVEVEIYLLIPEKTLPLLSVLANAIIGDVSGRTKFKRIEEWTDKPTEGTHNKHMPFSDERKCYKRVNLEHSIVISINLKNNKSSTI